MKPITPIQQKIYEFLVETAKNGMTPSVREIGAAVGLRSTSSVQANLDALEAAGYIQRPPMLKRCIKIVGQADNVTHVPLLGTVTAGSPILAVEEIEGYLPFSMVGAQDKELFALKVKGESMIQAGILAGDRIVAVNDTAIAGVKMERSEIMRRLRGPKGSTVTLTVSSAGAQQLLDFKITRDKIPLYTVDAAYKVNESTGYVRINRFAATIVAFGLPKRQRAVAPY